MGQRSPLEMPCASPKKSHKGDQFQLFQQTKAGGETVKSVLNSFAWRFIPT
jgi:hypothetical protein